MKRPILLHPDPRLKKAAAPVADLSDELRVLGDDMLTTMYDAPGIGLAAPQIGVLSRVIVLDCVKEEGEAPRPLLMFNPEIVASSDDLNTYEEGCLSIPEQYASCCSFPSRSSQRTSTSAGRVTSAYWSGMLRHPSS